MDRVTLKLKSDGIVRRVALKQSPVSMEEVRQIVASMFQQLPRYELSYTDEEGDRILVECDSELLEALEVSLQATKVPLIRLDVTRIEEEEEKKEEVKQEEKKKEELLEQEVEELEKKIDQLDLDALFRCHYIPGQVFRSRTSTSDPNGVVTVEAKKEEEEKEEVKEEEEKKEEVKEEVKEEESYLPNPVGILHKMFFGEKEEVKEEVKEEEVKEEEEVPEARRKALEALSPMGFEEKRMTEVLDFVDNNVEAALEILVGDAC